MADKIPEARLLEVATGVFSSFTPAEEIAAANEILAFHANQCEDCNGDPLVWFAPNALWNLVKGGPKATDDPGGFLCPNCFIKRAEAQGIRPTAWRLMQEDLSANYTDADTVLSQFVAGLVMGPGHFSGLPKKSVFNALTYLTRTKKIERLGYGKYRLLE